MCISKRIKIWITKNKSNHPSGSVAGLKYCKETILLARYADARTRCYMYITRLMNEIKMIWEYPDEMLITMCNECHSLEHNMDNLITKLLHMIKTRGVTNHEIITLLDFIDTKLFNGESDAILKITGEYGIPEITNYPYVKQLENRRNLIKNGTAKQNRS